MEVLFVVCEILERNVLSELAKLVTYFGYFSRISVNTQASNCAKLTIGAIFNKILLHQVN